MMEEVTHLNCLKKKSYGDYKSDFDSGIDVVGDKFEKGTIFLPQLILAADVAKECFDEIKNYLADSGDSSESKGKIIVATVKGDIHDIGKNIVKVILENYGYNVIDLGRDVDCMEVVNAAIENDVHLLDFLHL